MRTEGFQRVAIILLHASVGWSLCAAIVALGRRIMSLQKTLVAHAIGAPAVFALVSLSYFVFFAYTPPLLTAAIFLAFVVLMDVLVVALLVERSFVMFTSVLGTWLPFLLILVATYLVGILYY